jgi:oligopeptide transport system permease protein
MVTLSMQIPAAIFSEAFLSFIGLGIPAPQASWGTLCNDALSGLYVYPYQIFLPAIAISLTILAFNLFSDGLRDAFDPKQRR